MKRNIILFSILTIPALFTIYPLENQPTWELFTAETGNKSYVARDYIKLKPGFTYKAIGDSSFHAIANPCLLFPPTNNTYIDENGNIVTEPLQGSVVGKIPGEIDINPSGAATYTIPISCPAGIQGMQPELSLMYNSQTGNGVAGQGWNIGNISMISRSGKNYYYDNEKSGIYWDKK